MDAPNILPPPLFPHMQQGQFRKMEWAFGPDIDLPVDPGLLTLKQGNFGQERVAKYIIIMSVFFLFNLCFFLVLYLEPDSYRYDGKPRYDPVLIFGL